MTTNNKNYKSLKSRRLELLHDSAGTLRSVTVLKKQPVNDTLKLTARRKVMQVAEAQHLQGPMTAATFFNYQKALAGAELQAAELYKKLQKCSGDAGAETLLSSLRQTVQNYQKLHNEAGLMQQAFAISPKTGGLRFNEANYFIAKLRCGAEVAQEQDLFALLFNDAEVKLQALNEFGKTGAANDKVTKQLLNNATGELQQIAADFLGIMSVYEKAIQETFTVAELWRQLYGKDEVVKALVRVSMKLAYAGHMELTEAAAALALVLRQYAVELNHAYEAEAAGNEIIDIWLGLQDSFGIEVKEMLAATEAAAGTAYRAGIDFPCLQALAAALISSSTKQGEEAGRYLRALFIWLGSNTAVEQFNKIGVDCYIFNEQGQKQLRRLQDVILETVQQQNSVADSDKLLTDIDLGCFNVADMGGLFGGCEALQQKLQTAAAAKGSSEKLLQANSGKMQLQLLHLQQQADQLLEQLLQSDMDEEQELARVLAELSAGLKNLQPDFITAFQIETELLLLFKTILTVAEAVLTKNQQGISAILKLHTVQTGKARGSVWR